MNDETQDENAKTEHDWLADAIGPRLIGVLSALEIARFDQHLKSCESCATLWNQSQETDAAMTQLMLGTQPDAMFEDRLIAAPGAAIRKNPRQ